MKRYLAHILLISSLFTIISELSSVAYSQSITTVLNMPLSVDKNTANAKQFSLGDTVTVFGYKKSGKIHNFALQIGDYVDIIHMNGLPFDVNVKDLKKLPDASSEEIAVLVANKKKEILTAKKQKVKEKALKGEIMNVINNYYYLKNTDVGHGKLKSGDTVHVLGYNNKGTSSFLALYSKDKAGLYKVEASSDCDRVFMNLLDYDLLPSTEDPDVVTALREQISRIDNEEKERMRIAAIKKAQQDSIKAVRDAQILDSLKKESLRLTEELLVIIKKNSPIRVIVDSWYTNSVGRVSVQLTLYNCSTETIKYITVKAFFTNAVGDKCSNEIGGGYTWQGKGIGPIGPAPTTVDNFDERIKEYKASYDFDNNSFYSRTAHYIHISSVIIQYMSGKTITLSGNSLQSHVHYK